MARSRTTPAEQSRKREAQSHLEWERRENPPWMPTVLPAAAIGTIRAVEGPGRILVDLPEGGTVAARSCVPVAISDVGREGTFVFENGNALLPILVGLLQGPVAESTPPPAHPAPFPAVVRQEGQRILLTAERSLELRCGRATITLSRDGSLEIRGVNLLSRASGTNKIRGGTVHLN